MCYKYFKKGSENLYEQMDLIIKENKELKEKVKQLEKEVKHEYEATCEAKDKIIDLLNQIHELERRLKEMENLHNIN